MRHGAYSPPEPPEGTERANTWISRLLSSRAVQESISCFTPPSLWHFVMIALGNQHTGFKRGLQQ